MRWDHSRDQRLGRDVLVTTHRLAELPIFSDQGLAEILDRYPREALRVSTMRDNPAHPSQSQIGQLGQHSGRELVAMIRRGRLCVQMKNVVLHHEELRRIVGRLCGELLECQPGLRTSDHNGDLEISSPTVLTYYRCDVKPNVFWQIRGGRKVWVYPCGEPFVHTRSLEESIACGSRKPLYFEPAFDDQAQLLPQMSGDLLSLPQHTPYRIVNDDHLSVTLTTDYLTRESRRRNEIHCANHVLNRFLPLAGRSDETLGFQAAVKRVLLRVAGTREVETLGPPTPTFRVDPDSPSCIGPLDSTTHQSNATNPTFPGLSFEAATSATVVSEN